MNGTYLPLGYITDHQKWLSGTLSTLIIIWYYYQSSMLSVIVLLYSTDGTLRAFTYIALPDPRQVPSLLVLPPTMAQPQRTTNGQADRRLLYLLYM